jgi:DNA-binding response OmpR family regulator
MSVQSFTSTRPSTVVRTTPARLRPVARSRPNTGTSATVLVEVAVVGAQALAAATRLAAELRDLVDSAGAETSGVQISASVGLQLASQAAAVAPETPVATPSAGPIPRPEFVAPQAVAKPVRSTAALKIYPARRVALLDGKPVPLTRREFDLLLFLAEHAGRVFDRPQLLRLVWGHQVICGERTVDVHVRRLRAKVEKTGPMISTVRGVGYRLDAAEQVAVVREN